MANEYWVTKCLCGCGKITSIGRKYIWGHNPSKTTWKKGHLPWNKGLHKRLNTGRTHFKKGKDSLNWKGGVTDLKGAICNLPEYKKWKRRVMLKCHFKCVCGNKFDNIHHLKPFSEIMQEFCMEYSQFSPLEDTYILSKLSVHYKPFWDLDNGIALCRKCHDRITYKKDNKWQMITG